MMFLGHIRSRPFTLRLPLLGRFAPRPGLVTLRQTFVCRCQKRSHIPRSSSRGLRHRRSWHARSFFSSNIDKWTISLWRSSDCVSYPSEFFFHSYLLNLIVDWVWLNGLSVGPYQATTRSAPHFGRISQSFESSGDARLLASADAITAALAPAGRAPPVFGNGLRRLVGSRYAVAAGRHPAYGTPLAGLSRLR
jgi:hypothetical protein